MEKLDVPDPDSWLPHKHWSDLLNYIGKKSSTYDINKYLDENYLLPKSHQDKLVYMVNQMQQFLCSKGFKCKLLMYGSVANSLAFRDRFDVDIFVQIEDKNIDWIYVYQSDYSDIRSKLTAMREIFEKHKKFLFANDVFIALRCTRRMRVPLLTITIETESVYVNSDSEIVPIQIECEFNVNCGLGLANSKLIRFFCQMEPRFKAVSMIIRLWLRETYEETSPEKLSSYASTLMVLYYFQRISILPSVNYLMTLSSHSVNPRKFTNGWRVDFCDELKRVNFRSSNNDTVYQLVVGFFQFYSEFNFFKFKIFPRSGLEEYKHYFNEKIELIDPFDLNHNLTSRVNYQDLIHNLSKAYKKCVYKNNEN